LKIDLKALKGVTEHWRGVGVTLFINWGVKPFSMALLAWLFIGWLFRPWLPAEQIDSYIAGLILLAAAPCTAMVFVWSNLSRGEPHFTLTQVALNDVIMVFAFAPIVGLLLGLGRHHRALGYPAAVGAALHRRSADHRQSMAHGLVEAGSERRSARSRADDHAAHLAARPPGHPGAAVRLPGRADHRPAADHRSCSPCPS
jgi:hypothetical protein